MLTDRLTAKTPPVLASLLIASLLLPAGATRAVIPLETTPAWTSTPEGYVATGGAWSDVNGDGWLDMVVANGNDISRQRVVIYYNNGDGTLPLTPAWVSGDRDYNGHLDVGDVNGDDLPDLVVGVYLGLNGFSQPGQAKLYLNDGAGAYIASPVWVSGIRMYCFSVALGDADGDGDLDLACAAGESYTGRPERSMVFYNIGGTFEATPSWQEPDSAYALDVTWDDVDLDGDQDLLFCGIIGANRLYLNRQTAGGGLPDSADWQSSDAPEYGNTAALGDWNHDGYPELAVADNFQEGGSGRFKVYENTLGTLSAFPVWQSLSSDYGSHVSWVDVDFDGDADLGAGRWWDPARIYENFGGALGVTAAWTSSTSSVIENMFWGDVDNDDLRSDGVTVAGGDGARTYVKLGRSPVRSVDEVTVNGTPLPPTAYVEHLGGGWLSLATPPGLGERIEVRYTYSADLDLGITNWDSNKGNYLFRNTGSAVSAEDLASTAGFIQVRPNPVRHATVLHYRGDGARRAELAIFDVSGRKVRTLHDGPLSDGLHTWEWQATGRDGSRVAGGVYFARFTVGRRSTTVKVVVL
jgi:hypothetical protein